MKFKKTKLPYYTRHVLMSLLPRFCFEKMLPRELEKIQAHDGEAVMARVNYYNKLSSRFELDETAGNSGRYRLPGNPSLYYYDLKQYLRYFPSSYRFDYRFGDVTKVPPQPAFVKSRPVAPDHSNENSVVMKLDEVRHFRFVNDELTFPEKADIAIFRGCGGQAHRDRFIENCYRMSRTDIGDVRKDARHSPVYKPFMSVSDQLRNKFIISVEGMDVATNLKWIMSSNSLCFMIRPRYETWFMEGALVPDHHFVLLRDDYADLPEKIDHYIRHPEEALYIIENARKHALQFMDLEREKLVSFLVLKKYFELAGQAGSQQGAILPGMVAGA